MNRALLIAGCLLLAACQAEAPVAPGAPAEPDAPAEPGAPPTPQLDSAEARALAADGEVTASYDCAEGNAVDLVREGRVARLSLSDGRTIRLGEIANSQPRTWADVGLRFVIDGDFIELSQSNGEHSLACQPRP